MNGEPILVGILPGPSRRDDPDSPARFAGLMADRGIAAEFLGGGPSRAGCDRPDLPPPVRLWRRFWSMRALSRRQGRRPDLLHAMSFEDADRILDLAERWRVPYLLTVEQFLPPGGKLRLSRRWCRGVVATNVDLADELIRELHLPGRLVSVCKPGIVPPTGADRPRKAGCVPVVGAASGLALGSGLPIFLDAARGVLATGIDAEFVVAAESSGSTARLLGEGLGIADRITLAEPSEGGPSFWSVLDVYCHPARVASTGRSLATAMAHGIPSIVSDMPGLRPWVDDGRTGRLVPPGDAGALSRAIAGWLANPALAAEIGRNGREFVERECSATAEADAMATLYRAAAGSSEGMFPRVRADGSLGAAAASRLS